MCERETRGVEWGRKDGEVPLSLCVFSMLFSRYFHSFRVFTSQFRLMFKGNMYMLT